MARRREDPARQSAKTVNGGGYMNRVLGMLIGGIFLMGTGVALFAAPPGPGKKFDCSQGGTSSCATDDAGCVPDTPAHAKCAAGIVKAFAKAIGCIGKCHCKQATALATSKTFVEEPCEGHNPPKNNGCQDKFDAAISKLNASGNCSASQITLAGIGENIAFASKQQNSSSLDALNGGSFCDSTSGAMIMASDSDDAGFVPTAAFLKCECGVAKNRTRLAAAVPKVHTAMATAFFKGKDYTEELFEGTNAGKGALDKYNKTRDKLLASGGCPSCLDQAHQDSLAAGDTATLDGLNVLVYPCPPPTTTTTVP